MSDKKSTVVPYTWGNVPTTIVVPFYYKNRNKHYVLEGDDFCIEQVSLDGILRFIEELIPEDRSKWKISYWEPTQYGHQCLWRCDGTYLMSNHQLKEC